MTTGTAPAWRTIDSHSAVGVASEVVCVRAALALLDGRPTEALLGMTVEPCQVVERTLPSGSVARVSSSVRLTLDGRVARIEVTERFRNDGGVVAEGSYLYPLPGEAVFSDFSLWSGEQELKGETMRAEEARRIYEEIVRRRKWLTSEELLDLIGATNLIPGPNSTDMVMHVGRLRAGREPGAEAQLGRVGGHLVDPQTGALPALAQRDAVDATSPMRPLIDGQIARLDRELFAPGTPPFTALAGGPDFQSVVSRVFELGYRAQAAQNLSFSITAFHHEHENLRTLSPGSPGPMITNGLEGSTSGVEAWGTWRVAKWWRMDAGVTLLDQSLELKPGATDLQAQLGGAADPDGWGKLRAAFDLGASTELDVMLRHYGRIESRDVPSYTALDARLANLRDVAGTIARYERKRWGELAERTGERLPDDIDSLAAFDQDPLAAHHRPAAGPQRAAGAAGLPRGSAPSDRLWPPG